MTITIPSEIIYTVGWLGIIYLTIHHLASILIIERNRKLVDFIEKVQEK